MSREKETKETHVSTWEIAAIFGVRAQTVRRALCVDGHYLGIQPIKLPNRKLLWPLSEIKKLIGGGVIEERYLDKDIIKLIISTFPKIEFDRGILLYQIAIRKKTIGKEVNKEYLKWLDTELFKIILEND